MPSPVKSMCEKDKLFFIGNLNIFTNSFPGKKNPLNFDLYMGGNI